MRIELYNFEVNDISTCLPCSILSALPVKPMLESLQFMGSLGTISGEKVLPELYFKENVLLS